MKTIIWLFAINSIVWIGISNQDTLQRGMRYIERQFGQSPDTKTDLQERINKIVKIHKGKAFGIDVSEYQGIVVWKNLGWIKKGAPISFAIIRASAGEDRHDDYFTSNWRESKKNGFIRGAYHYYRPNENSIKQAENFIAKVKLNKGDLPPILDIEAKPDKDVQTMERLRKGLKKWLKKVEEHYGIKPIVYTNENYYNYFLKGHGFDKYPLWIANYKPNWGPQIPWKIWQFTSSGRIRGVKGNVDLNVFRGGIKKLREMGVKK